MELQSYMKLKKDRENKKKAAIIRRPRALPRLIQYARFFDYKDTKLKEAASYY